MLFRELEFASILDKPDGRGVIAAVEVGNGVAVAPALVESPKLCRVGLDVKLAKPLRNIDVVLLGAIGVVALLEEGGNPTSLSPNKAIGLT
jgi:hypothetical protein